jgi:uncharacterized protein YozE (UPF0346 family)
MTFKNYVTRRLAGYIGGRQGQLAVMIRDDPDFPETSNYDVIRRYIDSNDRLREYGGTPFRIIWDRYMEDERSGINQDLITRDRYKPVLSAIWTGFKRAMRHDDLDERLKAWDELESYVADHIVTDCPEFADAVMKVFKAEIVRDAEDLPFLVV